VKKNIILLFFFVFTGITSAKGQSHNYQPGCRYYKKPQVQGNAKSVSDFIGCPACNKQRDDERKARVAEDTRRAELYASEQKAYAEKIKREKAAADAKQLKEAEDRKQRDEALKELEEYSRNQQRYLDNLKIDVNRTYSGYNAVKASQVIPAKMKMLKLVENKYAKTYELFSGEELVKSFSQAQYWLYQLNKDLPYFIISDRQRKINRLSIIDSKGEPITISGERSFDLIRFNEKNNTLEFEFAMGEPESLGNFDGISGVYNSKADVQKIINVVKLEREKRRNIPDDVDSRGYKSVKITIAFNYDGHSAKRIVAGIDLTILESITVYIVR
jgi:hypothetical protein